MMGRQSWRSPELVRRSRCCGREAWAANGKLWCPACGTQILRASDVFGSFAHHPFPAPPFHPPSMVHRNRRAVADDQGTLL